MPRIRLLHWKSEEAVGHVATLGRARFQVEYEEGFHSGLMKSWRESPPDVFVIDLSRLPSQGREIAVALRQSPRTRAVPIVFCGGAEAKVLEVRKLLPDADYCTVAELAATVRAALKKPVREPVKPPAMMERFQSRTAAQKLGIRPQAKVAVIDGPAAVFQVLGELPAGVELVEEWTPEVAAVLCFLHAGHAVEARLSEWRQMAGRSKLWMIWRKGGSAARGDVTEGQVRRAALELGLVDYKICAVDGVWTGMLFARRR